MSEQSKRNNKRLMSKERTVGITLWSYTKYQLWRYLSALKYIQKTDTVVDIGAGCGYGSYILSQKASKVISVDDSKEAVDFANSYFDNNNIERLNRDILTIEQQFDVVVAYEILEHFKDDDMFFQKLASMTKKYLILTVPDTSSKIGAHHWRHYTPERIEELYKNNGFDVEELRQVLHKPHRKVSGIFAVGSRQGDE